MRPRIPAPFLLLALLGAAPAAAQQAAAGPAHPVVVAVPAAAPEDVASIDAIVAALYDVISGPVGEPRDWDRLRSLFVPGGRLVRTGSRPEGGVGIDVMDVNDYVATSGPRLLQLGFSEREVARRTERFGHIAHVLSTYEGHSQDRSLTVRGINSIQLVNDGSRWWVLSLFWEAEGPGSPLPQEYLPRG
ncbi:MAG TPA: hypothetical protein VHG51_07665 [Longimicrobiaceae bacterium]|nr:hypothetical protein [Longimicrobiaceae bacterium]